MKRIIKLFILCLLTLFMIPTIVYADGGTYITPVTPTKYWRYRNDFYIEVSDSNVRVCILMNNNHTKWCLAIMSDSPGSKWRTGTLQNIGNSTWNNMSHSHTFDNQTYYTYEASNFSGTSENGGSEFYIPVNVVPSGVYNSLQTGYNYLFGANSTDPAPEFQYGTIKDLSYSTSIIGSGNGTGSANKDTISWYPFADSNGRMYGVNGQVELRVVPGDYISGTQEGLLTQTYSDFVLDYANAGHLTTVDAYQGSYSVTWGTVMNKLSMTWPALQLIFDGDYWKKVGWVYQARYHNDEGGEDTWSEWQTVYTITSSTPTGTDGLDPSDGTALPGFYQDVQDSFNTTSIVNNNTNITYYINNVSYTVNETPENQNPSSGDSFWDWIGSLINALLTLVGTIGGWVKDLITAVLGLAGDIIDGILGLFHLPDFTINNYNTEVQTIKQNSGIFGQAVDFVTDIKTQLDTISTSTQDLVVTFPGISIMNTQIIPEVNGSYTQIISDLGLTDFHNLVYLCTDGFVIISLIVLVYRKLMEVLKK